MTAEPPIDLEPGAEEQVARINRVLEGGWLTMVFQPIVDLQTGRVRGVESLARLSAEPLRPPDLWFREAVRVGRGVELDLLTITEGLRQLDRLAPDMYMSINASPATASSPALAAVLEPLPLERVMLEVTEHDAVTDYESLTGSLANLRSRGLRLAIDDMGSGYANLRHILELRPDVIKLDAAIARDIEVDAPRRTLAASLTAFAGEANARVVGEGIETRASFETLRDLGVHLGQGYYFSPPRPLPLPAEMSP